jgi:hypothetical protein
MFSPSLSINTPPNLLLPSFQNTGLFFCVIVSHPVDTMVPKLNNMKSAEPMPISSAISKMVILICWIIERFIQREFSWLEPLGSTMVDL